MLWVKYVNGITKHMNIGRKGKHECQLTTAINPLSWDVSSLPADVTPLSDFQFKSSSPTWRSSVCNAEPEFLNLQHLSSYVKKGESRGPISETSYILKQLQGKE